MSQNATDVHDVDQGLKFHLCLTWTLPPLDPNPQSYGMIHPASAATSAIEVRRSLQLRVNVIGFILHLVPDGSSLANKLQATVGPRGGQVRSTQDLLKARLPAG